MREETVGILGAGAIGHMLAYFFQKFAGLSVHLLGRQGRLLETQLIHWQNNLEKLTLDGAAPPASLWFCCLKAHGLVEGLREFLKGAGAGTSVIVLSNGYIEPLLQPLRRDYPLVTLRKGLVSRGVKVLSDGTYSIGPVGQVIWGDDRIPTALEQRIIHQLSAQGFQWNQQCCRLRREKWYYNTCLNTLCGVRRLARNGQAADEWREELEALSHEVFALAQELWPDWQPAARQLWQNLLRLIANTADNENSMAADVRLGRSTEASVLSGMVLHSHQPEAYPLLMAFDRKLRNP